MDEITIDDLSALAEKTDTNLNCASAAVTAARYLLTIIAEKSPKDAVLEQAEFMLDDEHSDSVYSTVCGTPISPVAMTILKLSGSLKRSRTNA